MKVAVIGSGEVGKRIGKEFTGHKHDVIFYDINKEQFIGLEGYETTLDIGEAIEKSHISFIAVPTNLVKDGSGRYDFRPLTAASLACGNALKEKDGYHVFVVKSTVTPGATESIVISNIEEGSGKKAGEDFGVVYNPEFLTVIENTWTEDESFHIDSSKEGRIILGEGNNKKAGDVIEKFYKSTIFETALEKTVDNTETVVYRKVKRPVPIFRKDYKTAEMTKLVANNRLALATSFTNEIFLHAEELKETGIEVDMDFIAKMVAMDSRIGIYGSTYGKAWGGPCLKKDTIAFKKWLEESAGTHTKLIKDTIEINEEMKERFGVRE